MAQTTFMLLAPPYASLLPLDDNEEFPQTPSAYRGAALVWNLASGHQTQHLHRAVRRPCGLPLVVLIPSRPVLRRLRREVLDLIENARPHSVLPSQPFPAPEDLSLLLRMQPADLPTEVLDYLSWRGLILDPETRRIIRRTIELSSEVRTLSVLAKRVYLSRRALGRRFQERGLPVPSHWLQVSRQLRAVISLQTSSHPLTRIAHSLGYPDGFTLSNQMHRLVGIRPSVARIRLGWEWFLEEWLQQEWNRRGLRIHIRGLPSTSTRSLAIEEES